MKRLALCLPFLVACFGLIAQTKLTEGQRIATEGNQKEEGWYPHLKLGASFQYSTNDKVIGQVDGSSLTFGGALDGGLKYFVGQHEWRQALNLTEAYSKTPTINGYVKNSDELKYDSLYLYTIESLPWLGPYARVQLITNVFFGEDARSKAVAYNLNGTTLSTSDKFKLTDGFSPVTLKESVGFFAKAIEEKDMKLEFRLGLGAQQVVVGDHNYAITDYNDGASKATLKALSDYSEAGLEGGALFTGQIDDRTSYKASLDLMTPFINNDPQDRDAFELTNVEFTAGLNSKIFEWLSWTYEFKAKRQPQLLSDYQIQQMLLLNFNYTIL